jgi:hypothetical protein
MPGVDVSVLQGATVVKVKTDQTAVLFDLAAGGYRLADGPRFPVHPSPFEWCNMPALVVTLSVRSHIRGNGYR